MQEENKYYLCHIEYIDRDGAHDEYIVTNDEDAMLRDYKRAYPERIITACATAELARVISAVQNKADVVEVRHGEWVRSDEYEEQYGYLYKCSVCGVLCFLGKYCPNCGAKMEGD